MTVEFTSTPVEPVAAAATPAAGTPAVPATTPAAPATHVVPVAPEAKPADTLKLGDDPKEPVVPNTDTATPFEYEPTGDAGLDYALNFVGKLGFGSDHPAIIAAQKGDFALLKVELATRGVAGAEAVVALAEQAHGRFAAEDAKKDAELASFASSTAGSPENWAVVRQWAAAEATPQEKAQVNAALAQGGIVAKGVIAQLVEMYKGKHTLTKTPATVATGAAASSSAGEPMTAREYAKQVEALRRQYGQSTDTRPEYAALQAQRLAARAAGF